jgi:hypothetical protein
MRMTDPVDIVNELLGLSLGKTFLADEVKGCRPDNEGGTHKFYLNAVDCRALADAFAQLAVDLDQGTSGRSW